MHRISLVSLLALTLAACQPEAPTPAADSPAPAPAPTPAQASPAPAAPAPSAAALARFDGYGSLRFGMSEADARAAWDGALGGGDPAATGDACHYLFPASAARPADLAFMFEGGRFVRYDIGTGADVAPGGGKVGMGAADIRALYPGRVAESPHKYVEGGLSLRIPATSGDGVLVFETDADGRVTAWRAGLAPQVDYVEGCS